MSNALERFVQQVLRWIRKQFTTESDQPPGELEKQTTNASLYRVPNDESGVCCCYWVRHQAAQEDLVFSLISLQQLRQDIAFKHPYRRTSDPVRFTSKSAFQRELDTYLESQGGLDTASISHIFVAAWRSRTKTIRKVGDRRTEFYLVRPLCAIPADMQGATFAWGAGDRYAIEITKAIALKTLRISHSQKASWGKKIDGIDWLEQLDFCATKVFGKSHILQPRS